MREIPVAFPEYTFGNIQLAIFLYKIGKEEEATAIFRATYGKLRPWEKTSAEQSPEGKAMLNR